ncbi:MAG: L-ribulose-5-phosphate 3-epimerase [Algoriphagus sp.]|jgi:L-ribulose-5-phosphate 3-epimerase
MKQFTRKDFLKTTALGLLSTSVFGNNTGKTLQKKRYQIGACDWSIGNKSNLGSMEIARQIGLDGAQLSLGLKENNMHLRQKEVQKAYKSLAKIFDVSFTGLGIGELNQYPYKSDSQTDVWVADSIDVAKALDVSVVLIAFFAKGDLKNDKKGTDAVIQKFKDVMPKAEKLGITLGIESWLSAEEHMDIIDKVASPNLKVYYDVANSEKMGYDIYEEIVWLGKQNQICEFHFKENGALLGQGKVDFQRVKKCMDEIDYRGAIQIEGAVPKGDLLLPSYIKNNVFVRDLLS